MDLLALREEEPARAWNAVYALAVEHMDKKAREKFDSELFRKPPGVVRKVAGDKFDQELQAAAENYMKNRKGGNLN